MPKKKKNLAMLAQGDEIFNEILKSGISMECVWCVGQFSFAMVPVAILIPAAFYRRWWAKLEQVYVWFSVKAMHPTPYRKVFDYRKESRCAVDIVLFLFFITSFLLCLLLFLCRENIEQVTLTSKVKLKSII